MKGIWIIAWKIKNGNPPAPQHLQLLRKILCPSLGGRTKALEHLSLGMGVLPTAGRAQTAVFPVFVVLGGLFQTCLGSTVVCWVRPGRVSHRSRFLFSGFISAELLSSPRVYHSWLGHF